MPCSMFPTFCSTPLPSTTAEPKDEVIRLVDWKSETLIPEGERNGETAIESKTFAETFEAAAAAAAVHDKSKSGHRKNMVVHEDPQSRKVKTIKTLSDLDLSPEMAMYLSVARTPVTRPTMIQSIMWPAVDQKKSVVCVSSPGTGKTVGHVLPIINRLVVEVALDEDDKDSPRGSKDPRVVVVCPSRAVVKKGNQLHRLIIDIFIALLYF
jgi:hypothetical protein